MMGNGANRVLLVGGLDGFEQRVAGFFERSKLDVQRASDHTIASQMVENDEYGLFLVEYVDAGDPVRDFIRAARHHRSPSKKAALVVLSHPEHLDEAEQLLSEGVGRILNPLAGTSVLESALWEVCNHEHRHTIRLMLRIPGEDLGQKGLQIMQTTNISVSGMLVRCDKPVFVGSRFSFTLEASGLSTPISGRAAVVRIHRGTGQRDQGFGARFLRFERDGKDRLREFLQSQPAEGDETSSPG